MLNLVRLDSLPVGRLPLTMAGSDATALPLFVDDRFGADVIRFPAGGRVPEHTHPGAHLLLVLAGDGWLDFEGIPTELAPGTCYLIPANARHGIRARTDLTLLAVASDHRPADSAERLHAVAE